MSESPQASPTRREMLEATAAVLAASIVRAGVPPAPLPDARPAPFLTPAEYALLDELAERIIPADDHSPGARAAGVARYIDDRLAESPDRAWQERWRSGLQAVEGLSRELTGRALLEATADQRNAVLARMAAGEADPTTPLHHFFKELKSWTVRGYYTSKTGIHADQEYKGNVYQRGDYVGYDAR